MDELQCDELESTLLETSGNFSNKATLDTIRLEKGRFQSEKYNATESSSTCLDHNVGAL
jgi:hypothetical protein